MFRLSPFLLAALLFALGLSACTKKGDPTPSPAPAPAPENPKPPRVEPPKPTPTPVRLVNNAEENALLPLLDGAQASIDIEIYEMSDTDVLAALGRALDRGVKVRVVKDPKPLGSRCDLFSPQAGVAPSDAESCAREKALKDRVLAAGGAYAAFNKANLCADSTKPCFEHGKLLLVDGKTALVSTGNFNASNLCSVAQNPSRCNRDYSVITADTETVGLLSSIFELDLKGDRYELAPLLTTSLQAKVTVSPLSLPPILALIRSANTSIRIQNQYLQDRDMNDALMAAARRGVKVEVMVSSFCAFGPPSPQNAARAKEIYQAFDEAGILTRTLPAQRKIGGLPGYLHAKALLVDDTNAWVGSVNGSTTALSNNREFGLLFSDTAAVEALRKALVDDQTSPDTESWTESLECKKDMVPN